MHFIGIDVAKEKLDVAQVGQKKLKQFANTQSGWNQLIQSLPANSYVVLEATGGLETGILYSLLEAQIPVHKANAKRVKDFARALGQMAKTDKLDAQVLARFGQTFHDQLHLAHAPKIPELAQLCTYRRGLVCDRTATKNRLSRATGTVKALLEADLQYQNQQIKTVEAKINALIVSSEEALVLKQVKGVGNVLIASLFAYLPELGHLKRREIAALAGVAPYNRDSGFMQGERRIFGGRGALRQVLYMAANIARRYDPKMKAYYELLREKGKPFKVAITACMAL
jgi:transposase